MLDQSKALHLSKENQWRPHAGAAKASTCSGLSGGAAGGPVTAAAHEKDERHVIEDQPVPGGTAQDVDLLGLVFVRRQVTDEAAVRLEHKLAVADQRTPALGLVDEQREVQRDLAREEQAEQARPARVQRPEGRPRWPRPPLPAGLEHEGDEDHEDTGVQQPDRREARGQVDAEQGREVDRQRGQEAQEGEGGEEAVHVRLGSRGGVGPRWPSPNTGRGPRRVWGRGCRRRSRPVPG